MNNYLIKNGKNVIFTNHFPWNTYSSHLVFTFSQMSRVLRAATREPACPRSRWLWCGRPQTWEGWLVGASRARCDLRCWQHGGKADQGPAEHRASHVPRGASGWASLWARQCAHRTAHARAVSDARRHTPPHRTYQYWEPSSFVGHLFRVSSLFACKDTAFCVTAKVYWYFLCGVRMRFVKK